MRCNPGGYSKFTFEKINITILCVCVDIRQTLISIRRRAGNKKKKNYFLFFVASANFSIKTNNIVSEKKIMKKSSVKIQFLSRIYCKSTWRNRVAPRFERIFNSLYCRGYQTVGRNKTFDGSRKTFTWRTRAVRIELLFKELLYIEIYV